MSEIRKNDTNGVVATNSPKKNPTIVEPNEKSKHVVTVEEVEVSWKSFERSGVCSFRSLDVQHL